MFQALMGANPLDLIDDGIDASLDRLVGTIGVDGVSVDVASKASNWIRSGDVAPRVMISRGGLAFAPKEMFYTSTRCKSSAVRSWHGRSPLETIAQGCAARGLTLRAEVSASETGLLAKKNPAAACKNVYGVESTRQVCLTNPDVQAFLRGLSKDLTTNYSIDRLVIADLVFGLAEAFDDSLRCGIPLDDVDRSLLSMCFCESCQQSASLAGVAMDEVTGFVTGLLDKRLADSTAPKLNPSALLDNQSFAAFTTWQGEMLAALYAQIEEASACPVILDRCSSRRFAMLQRSQLTWRANETMVSLDEHRTENHRDSMEIRVPVDQWSRDDGANLVSTVTELVEGGVRTVTFDGYSQLPDSAYAAIRQAARFAKRQSS